MWLLKLTLALAGLYAVVVAVAYVLQSWLIFPAGLAAFGPDLPAGARHVELATEDGERVVLVRLPARQAVAEPRPLLLGFAGNAWNADALALMLHQLFPEHEVAALHYRGYAPSSGSPSASALFEDARRAHDHLVTDAKAGMVAMMKSLGAELASRNVTANCIAPGMIATPMTDVLNEAQRKAILDAVPAKRLGTADEVASAAVYLASDEAAYVTGATIHVNGGMAML